MRPCCFLGCCTWDWFVSSPNSCLFLRIKQKTICGWMLTGLLTSFCCVGYVSVWRYAGLFLVPLLSSSWSKHKLEGQIYIWQCSINHQVVPSGCGSSVSVGLLPSFWVVLRMLASLCHSMPTFTGCCAAQQFNRSSCAVFWAIVLWPCRKGCVSCVSASHQSECEIQMQDSVMPTAVGRLCQPVFFQNCNTALGTNQALYKFKPIYTDMFKSL